MELAGHAAAQAALHFLRQKPDLAILVVCGPGNNGGDGLVAARHLQLAGRRVGVLAPRQDFPALLAQLEFLGVPVFGELANVDEHLRNCAVLDCVFGFGFNAQKPIRDPYLSILQTFVGKTVISVDVPSGWSVDASVPEEAAIFVPSAIVSLSAPKACGFLAQRLGAAHYLAANLVPDGLKTQFKLEQLSELWRNCCDSFVLLK